MNQWDTWLTEQDIERIWRVTQGELGEEFVTHEELIEFENVVVQAAMAKWGMDNATVH